MASGRMRRLRCVLFANLLLMAAAASAQDTAGIAGVVKDSSAGVLPGVTVEASSPALIERTRTVVTDAQGQYSIVDLRPGVYAVTFSLPGFTSFKREAIELTTSFTATVNATLSVGEVAETITVSGQASAVDVRNVVQAQVMTRTVIDSVPVGNKNTASIGVLIPGMVTSAQDVGGAVFGSAAISIHGGRSGEMQGLFDGMYINNGYGVGGSFMSIALNDQTFQEMSIQTGGVSAESWMGSVRANAIPKDGGNTFKGTFFGAWTNHSLQSANLTPELEARGLHNTDSAKEIWDIAPAFGGPLVKDKLWFFGAWRRWATDFTIAGIYSNKSPVPYVYTPDLTRPSDELDVDMNSSLRLTWQATPRNKFVVHPQYNTGDRDHTYSNKTGPDRFTDPEATIHYYVRPSGFAETTWTAPVTSRLLIEAGSAFAAKDFQNRPQPDIGLQPYSYKELSTNLVWGNLNVASGNNHGYNWIQKLAVSYVTGSHAAKVGMDLQHSKSWSTLDATGPNEMTLQLLNGVPRQVTVFATPYALTEFTKYNLGLYGQDQWTIKHLTLNLGLRYDHLNSYVPAQHAGPAYWTPTRNVDFPEVDNVPNWQDWSPRLGATYDLFGNGKTALKATFGKYLSAPNQGTYTRLANPLNAIASSATRTWNDISPCAGGIVGDFLPQPCELGPVSNAAFGTSVITTSYAPDVNTSRGHDLESSVSVQHELLSGVSLTVGYYRRQYGNLTVTHNTAVTAADFSSYCVTAPVDPRLPNGGGYQVCGFSDVSAAKFGKVNNVIELAPQAQDVYDGVDINMVARLRKGFTVSGGVSDGRERTNICFAVNDPSLSFASLSSSSTAPVTAPRTSAFCDNRPPFQPNVKFLVVYPLPWWGLQTSATIQSIPGQPIYASNVYTNAQIAPSLGRNLSAGAAGTATLDLIPPGTQYGERLNQLNLRASKRFSLGTGRYIQGMVDLYNALNASPVLQENPAFNGTWPGAISVLQGRLLKFGMQLDF